MSAKPAGAASARLLLLQFLSFDDPLRQDRSEYFPFMLGQARDLGAQAWWLQSGIYSYATSHQNAHEVNLDEVETTALVDAMLRLQPTHLLVADALGKGVRARVMEALPELRITSMHDQPAEVQKLGPASFMPSVLGLPSEPWQGRYAVDITSPHYDCELVPPPRGHEPPPRHLLPVVCGPSCVYARSLTKNPHFEGVDLPGVIDLHACSFCRRAGGRRYLFETPPVELAVRQCVAAGATENKTFANVFRIRGAPVAMKIGEFVRRILEHPMPPSELCFEFRVDEMLRVAEAIDEVLPELAAAGHRLNLYNMGLENFSPTEQERYNKGVTTSHVLSSIRWAQRWRERFPDAFRFGNYGMVVFTPWTTLDDVEKNLEGIQRLRDEGMQSGERYIGSKLQLFREIALYELAKKDGVEFLDIEWHEGVVVDPETGFVWFDGHAKGSADTKELPWRFLHEQTAIFYELVWRACLAPEVDERARQDPLLKEVVALKESRKDLWPDALRMLRDALDVARHSPPPKSPRELFDRLVISLPAASPHPCAESLPAPRTPRERLLVSREGLLHAALSRLEEAPRSPLPGWRLVGFAHHFSNGARGIDCELEKRGKRLAIKLRPAGVDEGTFASGTALALSLARGEQIAVREQELGLKRLCSVLDRYLTHE